MNPSKPATTCGWLRSTSGSNPPPLLPYHSEPSLLNRRPQDANRRAKTPVAEPLAASTANLHRVVDVLPILVHGGRERQNNSHAWHIYTDIWSDQILACARIICRLDKSGDIHPSLLLTHIVFCQKTIYLCCNIFMQDNYL